MHPDKWLKFTIILEPAHLGEGHLIVKLYAAFAQTNTDRFANMFATVFFACVLSAPGNEIRGYCLQPKRREKPFMEFLEPFNFVRSTGVGSIIMSKALVTGALVTPKVQEIVSDLRGYLDNNPLSKLLIGPFVLQKISKDREEKARKEEA